MDKKNIVRKELSNILTVYVYVIKTVGWSLQLFSLNIHVSCVVRSSWYEFYNTIIKLYDVLLYHEEKMEHAYNFSKILWQDQLLAIYNANLAWVDFNTGTCFYWSFRHKFYISVCALVVTFYATEHFTRLIIKS